MIWRLPMERLELNIPSKFSHSKFVKKTTYRSDEGLTEEKFEDYSINKTDIDYFYSIVYLYRLIFLEENENCMEKVEDDGGKKSYQLLEDEIDWEEYINIEFHTILSMLDENHNSKYDGIKNFIDNRFEDVYVKTNLFGKDKSEKSQYIKVFDKFEISDDELSIDVTFNKDYILPYIITKKPFKKVILNILFGLGGKYTKLMYLFFKDYEGITIKLTNKKLKEFLGNNFSVSSFNVEVKLINSYTDIEVNPPKKTKYKMRKTVKPLKISKSQWFLDEDEYFDYYTKQLIWEDSKLETQSNIDGGEKINDFEGYSKGIFKNKLKHQMEFYSKKFKIIEYLNDCRENLQSQKEETDKTQMIVTKLKKEVKGYNSCIIGDDCYLYGYPSLLPITESISETKKIMDKNFDGCFIGYYDKTVFDYELSTL